MSMRKWPNAPFPSCLLIFFPLNISLEHPFLSQPFARIHARLSGFWLCSVESTASWESKHHSLSILLFRFLAQTHGLWDLSSPGQELNPSPSSGKCTVLPPRLPGKFDVFCYLKKHIITQLFLRKNRQREKAIFRDPGWVKILDSDLQWTVSFRIEL